MLQKFHPAVKKYINTIPERPISKFPYIHRSFNGNFKVELKKLHLEVNNNSNKNALVKRKLKS